ncbi:hypothetical protein AB0M95_27965 [Sphaerisporangium sp. NPDC051017]|uniref:hypothetical protein n=1 Tax=Sphaerisporangium sp. NPDC051017 TaxID=3154636 RepID=UPI00343F5A41
MMLLPVARTVAVKVTECPFEEGFWDEVSVVLVEISRRTVTTNPVFTGLDGSRDAAFAPCGAWIAYALPGVAASTPTARAPVRAAVSHERPTLRWRDRE